MKRLIAAVGLCALIPGIAQSAPTTASTPSSAEEPVRTPIFSQSYSVAPYIPYQTGFQVVLGSPVKTRKIYLTQAGEGCQIVSTGVHYLNSLRRTEQVAVPTGGRNDATYAIPDGEITQINVLFEQHFSYATCTLTVEADIESDGDDEWLDWETVTSFDIRADWGSEEHRVGPFAINDLVKAVRIYVPRVCGDIALIGSALQLNGEWQELTSDDFAMARTPEEKTFTYNFGTVAELDQVAFRLRGKRRDCRADVQVVYY